MRAKISKLEEALTGHFEDHHGFICQLMLERIDELTTKIDELSRRIDLVIAPFAHQVTQLDEVSGIGQVAAQELIAELGVDMAVFPTAAHLVSWAKFAPQARQSAGKTKSASTGQGNPWLGATLGEVVAGASRTNTFLAERYRRLVKHRGKGRAIVAVGNSVLTIVWHPALRPRGPLPRPRSRLLRISHQPAAPPTQPHPPARTSHRPQGHPATQTRATRRITQTAAPPTSPTRPGSAALRRVLPPAPLRSMIFGSGQL